MARRERSKPTASRRGVVLAAAVVWIVVIAAGAGVDADDSLLGIKNIDVVWIILFALVVLVSIVFLIFLDPFSGEWIEPESTKRRTAYMFLLLLVFAMLVFQPDFVQDFLAAVDVDLEPAGDPLDGEGELIDDVPTAEPVVQLTDILLLVVAIVAIGGVWFVMRRRDADTVYDVDQGPTAFETDMVQALDRAAVELDTSDDPRTAVLRSYAVLEATLASHGFVRAKSETPTEHVRRSLHTLRLDAAPVVQLGGLYEIARFSDRSISKAQQDNAAQALRRAQESLAIPS